MISVPLGRIRHVRTGEPLWKRRSFAIPQPYQASGHGIERFVADFIPEEHPDLGAFSELRDE